MTSRRLIVALAVLAAASGAAAQVPAKPPQGNPPREAGLPYASAFSDYRAYEETSPADWRMQNDRVRQAAAIRSHEVAKPDKMTSKQQDLTFPRWEGP